MMNGTLKFRPRTRWLRQRLNAFLVKINPQQVFEGVLLVIVGMFLCLLLFRLIEVICRRDPVPATCLLPEGGELLESWGNGWCLVEAHGDTFVVVLNGNKPWAITQYSGKE